MFSLNLIVVDIKVREKAQPLNSIVAFYVFINIGCMHVDRSFSLPGYVQVKRQPKGVVFQVPGRQSPGRETRNSLSRLG